MELGEVRVEGVPYTKGGRQGGSETPFIWNRLLDSIMTPLAKEWENRGYGLQMPSEAPRLTHLIWADNIWIIAESITQARKMMKMLTGALLARRLVWKDGSLEFLASHATMDMNIPFKWKSAGLDMECIKVEKMNML